MAGKLSKEIRISVDAVSASDLERLLEGDASIEEVSFYAKLFAKIMLSPDDQVVVELASKS